LAFSDGSIACSPSSSTPSRCAPRRARSGCRRSQRHPRAAEPDARDLPDYSGAVLHAGRRLATVSLDDDDGTYVLFGPAEPIVSGR
jgi:hypothetical protein